MIIVFLLSHLFLQQKTTIHQYPSCGRILDIKGKRELHQVMENNQVYEIHVRGVLCKVVSTTLIP